MKDTRGDTVQTFRQGGSVAAAGRLSAEPGNGSVAPVTQAERTYKRSQLGLGVETFATLVNKGLLSPSDRPGYMEVAFQHLVQCLRSQVELIHVDDLWYRSEYPDVVEAMVSGRITSSKEHYVLSGYYENRMPYHIEVEEDWYLSQYEDVRDAVATGYFASGQLHFRNIGYSEGRIPFPHFQLRLSGGGSRM